MAVYRITLNDYNVERSSFSLPGAITTAANYDAQIGLIADLKTAVEAVTLGATAGESYLAFDTYPLDNSPAGSGFAQRETKWLVTIVGDVSGKLYQREIPTADLAQLAPNSDEMASNANRTALVDAIEAFFRGDALETGTVTSIRHVGRNS